MLSIPKSALGFRLRQGCDGQATRSTFQCIVTAKSSGRHANERAMRRKKLVRLLRTLRTLRRARQRPWKRDTLLQKLGWELPPQPPPRIRVAQVKREDRPHRDTNSEM